MAGPAQLPAVCGRRLAQLLQQVDDTDLQWLAEIREEAAKMFTSHYSDEPELMPKTPSQKSRQRRKRNSALREENQEPGRKRLSRKRNSSLRLAPRARCSQRLRNKENLELSRAEAKDFSPPKRVTRSQTAALAKSTESLPKTPPGQQAGEKVPISEADIGNHVNMMTDLQKSASKPAKQLSTTILLSLDDCSEKSWVAKSPPVPAATELIVPHTPEASDAQESKPASWLNKAKAANSTVILSETPGLEEVDETAQVQEGSDKEPSQPIRDSPETPTGSRLSRHSVRRSLMGKTSLIHRTSLAEKYSLASKRESVIRKSVTRTMVKRKAAQKSSVSSSCMDISSSGAVPEDEETVVKTRSPPGPSIPSKLNPQSPQMSLRSQTMSGNEQLQETSNNESNLNKKGETQESPQSARRKPSYKRAVDECYDSQQAEDGGLSPPRRKTPSPAFPASKVVRPFKTFLHTVQKNQLLMMPASVGKNGVIKSFIRYNTPIQSDPKGQASMRVQLHRCAYGLAGSWHVEHRLLMLPIHNNCLQNKEKERQKLETLRKKQEAEQLRKQKLEEEKKRRLGEAKLKREEHLRKVLQARERAEQIKEERKRRIEQKIALFDEKTEKVREERLAEEKIRKKAAAKKMEEAEARRRHDEEARKQKALQQEEEERRHRELMQKRKEEEQERARKIAEQRQAEQEREKQLAAERELERKKEQERIQAEKLREKQEKAAHLQKEVLAAKEQLPKEMEKKEQEKRLAELRRQEQEQKKLPEEQKAKDKAQTQHLENKENSPVCTSYQMTPQAQKNPKPPPVNPDNYGMDLNSDDSTDDESQPRKPIPAWATGNQLSQAVMHQYYNPPDVDALFGVIASPKLEDIFYKSKPRYFKRTSSAVWNSPPFSGAKSVLGLPYSLKKY
ncbi:inner centromere protein isoform X1 [Falco naumanni]|uniref:inner centromere protein isoform X1 n=1 Tax=Falco naumanni TaxID=148594 RepID=UPI001ADEA31B|nr:inner centromere protein isoform X1 [Falco naumanni]